MVGSLKSRRHGGKWAIGADSVRMPWHFGNSFIRGQLKNDKWMPADRYHPKKLFVDIWKIITFFENVEIIAKNITIMMKWIEEHLMIPFRKYYTSFLILFDGSVTKDLETYP